MVKPRPLPEEKPWLSAAEATALLEIKAATLYAYVSRGLIRSEQVSSKSRQRRYHAEDVRALLQKRELQEQPQQAVQQTLHWGLPVLDSALTCIADGKLSYRGLKVLELAAQASVEQVAALLWTGDPEGWSSLPLRARLNLSRQPKFEQPKSEQPLEAFAYALSHAAAHDLNALDLRPEARPAQAARVLGLLYATLERHEGVPPAPDLPLHARLARAWRVDHPELLRQALILLADHELNVSAFTARVTASSGASLHHATLAALCALQGPKHGLASLDAHDLLHQTETLGPAAALREAVRRSGRLPGFGHPLYPQGDPRAKMLLTALGRLFPEQMQAVRQLQDIAQQELAARANVDLALAALMMCLGRPGHDAVTLFALARSVGWLAHALETLETNQLIRPRARYVGKVVD